MGTTAYRLLLPLLAIWQVKAQESERWTSDYANNEPSLITAPTESALPASIWGGATESKFSDETTLSMIHAEFTSTAALNILETPINFTGTIDDQNDVSAEDALAVASRKANASPTDTTLKSSTGFPDSFNQSESTRFFNIATSSSIAGETNHTRDNNIKKFTSNGDASNISSSSEAVSTAVMRTTDSSVQTEKGSNRTVSNDLPTLVAPNGTTIPKVTYRGENNETDGAGMNGGMKPMSIVVIVCAGFAAAAVVFIIGAMAVGCCRKRCSRNPNSPESRGPSRLSVLWPRVRHSGWMSTYYDRVRPPRQQPFEMVENSLDEATQNFQLRNQTTDLRSSLSYVEANTIQQENLTLSSQEDPEEVKIDSLFD